MTNIENINYRRIFNKIKNDITKICENHNYNNDDSTKSDLRDYIKSYCDNYVNISYMDYENHFNIILKFKNNPQDVKIDFNHE